MPVRRIPSVRAVASLLWLQVAGCTFNGTGLGSTTLDLSGESSVGDSGPPMTGTSEFAATEASSTGTGSTGTSSTGSNPTEATPTTGSSDTGEPCPDGCPPQADWTAVAERVGYALAFAPGGDVLVAGEQTQVDNEDRRDVWVARLDGGAGHLRWEQRYNGAEGRDDGARALVVLDDGRIVAGGASQEVEERRQDAWVGWFDADGGLLTSGGLGTAQWDGDNVKLDESVRALAVDAVGELIASGTRCHYPCQVPDAWIGRFTREGVSQWSEPMLVSGPGALRAVAPLGSGLLAVGTDGHLEGVVPWRSLIRSFDASGAGSWSALQEPPGDLGFDAVGVAVTPGGELWVVGREVGVGVVGGFIRLYRPDRAFMPVQERRGPALDGEPGAIGVAADGSVVVTGTAGPEGSSHLWLGSFSGELEPLWRIDEPAESVNRGRAVVLDAAGVVVLGLVNASGAGQASTWLRRYTYQP